MKRYFRIISVTAWLLFVSGRSPEQKHAAGISRPKAASKAELDLRFQQPDHVLSTSDYRITATGILSDSLPIATPNTSRTSVHPMQQLYHPSILVYLLAACGIVAFSLATRQWQLKYRRPPRKQVSRQLEDLFAILFLLALPLLFGFGATILSLLILNIPLAMIGLAFLAFLCISAIYGGILIFLKVQFDIFDKLKGGRKLKQQLKSCFLSILVVPLGLLVGGLLTDLFYSLFLGIVISFFTAIGIWLILMIAALLGVLLAGTLLNKINYGW